MAHFIDVGKAREKIFTLNCIILSGEPFALKYNVGNENEPTIYPKSKYWPLLKQIVSNTVLELAVIIRNSRELLQHNDVNIEIERIITCADLQASNILHYDFIYIANKIIHAKMFKLTAVGSNKHEPPFEWWDGEVTVGGTLQNNKPYNKPWELSFDLSTWLGSIEAFLDSVEEQLVRLQMNSYDILRSN